MHKPSNSQLAPNIGGENIFSSGKPSSKISTLKNKAAFEKFHPSQQLAQQSASEFSPSQKPEKANPSVHSSTPAGNNLQQSVSGSSSSAVISKLSHYQKMSSGPQKRAYVRNSSKKNGGENPHLMGTQNLGHRIHVSNLDDKVKKSSSQSLLKMQAAQMMGVKDLQTLLKDERKQAQFKTPSGNLKKAYEGSSGTTKIDSGITKKLIFSFKKESKQKVTPPNMQTNTIPKPAIIGHHRRV